MLRAVTRHGRTVPAAMRRHAATAASAIPRSLSNAEVVKWLEANAQDAKYSKLANGFGVATIDAPRNNEHCTVGVWIDAGSRFETRQNNGTAHFLEHLLFKGTKNYTKQQIDTFFESTGSHFNAYTARDRTAYYVKCFNRYADQSMHIIADILRHSNLAPRDIENERPTIMSEMQDVESSVQEVIMDNLHQVAYDPSVSGLPLTILGPPENIEGHINREMLTQFTETHYTGPRMTLIAAGGLSHESAKELAEKHFGTMSSKNNRPQLHQKYVGGDFVLWNDTMMASSCAFAVPMCGSAHPDNIVLQLAQCLMGGYQKDHAEMFGHLVRENTKFASTEPSLEMIQPFYTPYEDTGLFGFKVDTVPHDDTEAAFSTLSRVVEGNLRHLIRLAYEPVSVAHLDSIKRSFLASQTMAMDNSTNFAEDLGRQVLHYGKRIPDAEVARRVFEVTPEDIMRVMQTYAVGARPAMSVIGHPRAMGACYDALADVAARATSGY